MPCHIHQAGKNMSWTHLSIGEGLRKYLPLWWAVQPLWRTVWNYVSEIKHASTLWPRKLKTDWVSICVDWVMVPISHSLSFVTTSGWAEKLSQSLDLDFGLGHMTCFDQEGVNKWDTLMPEMCLWSSVLSPCLSAITMKPPEEPTALSILGWRTCLRIAWIQKGGGKKPKKNMKSYSCSTIWTPRANHA